MSNGERIMKKKKSDLISGSDFTKLNLPKTKHHYPLPRDVIPEDENADQFQETIIGMEYDVESEEDIEKLIPDEKDEDT